MPPGLPAAQSTKTTRKTNQMEALAQARRYTSSPIALTACVDRGEMEIEMEMEMETETETETERDEDRDRNDRGEREMERETEMQVETAGEGEGEGDGEETKRHDTHKNLHKWPHMQVESGK